jgi:hypothetical protein
MICNLHKNNNRLCGTSARRNLSCWNSTAFQIACNSRVTYAVLDLRLVLVVDLVACMMTVMEQSMLTISSPLTWYHFLWKIWSRQQD